MAYNEDPDEVDKDLLMADDDIGELPVDIDEEGWED